MAETKKVVVIGAGMAGSEAAWFLANQNIHVHLIECKRKRPNPAQKTPLFAELVCTNSLKSTDIHTAHGLLKVEMQRLGSLILKAAQLCAVPAGSALAVDREKFSQYITQSLQDHPNISLHEREAEDPLALKDELKADHVIMASGPLTHPVLEKWIRQHVGEEDFYFYDAIAPVVDGESLDTSELYFKDRHADETDGDYLNCPLNKQQYYQFIDLMLAAEKVPPQDFEDYKFFEGCLPVDLMAERGVDTPRFSCMKPLGLEMPDGQRPYAVVQLRKENFLGSAFNLVGFQNRLTYKEQLRVFRTLPGFANAQFFHLGSVHRNSFLNASRVLNFDMSSKMDETLWFAGQITGVEGYTESASSGLYTAWQVQRRLMGQPTLRWPVQTCIGALMNYLMTCERPTPSNVNFGLFPPVEMDKKQKRGDRRAQKKQLIVQRAQQMWIEFEQTC